MTDNLRRTACYYGILRAARQGGNASLRYFARNELRYWARYHAERFALGKKRLAALGFTNMLRACVRRGLLRVVYFVDLPRLPYYRLTEEGKFVLRLLEGACPHSSGSPATRSASC